MRLSDADRSMLAGEQGQAKRFAMSILARMVEVLGAAEFIDISQAHIDSTLYQGNATLEFAERLVAMGAVVAVPSSLNVGGVDEQGWKQWAVPPEHARKARRQMTAYEAMGCVPSWTCAPYQTALRPSFGEQIAWGESNAVAFANSVLGARTEQYPDFMDICAAITGRVPAVGLHLDEGRFGQILFRLRGIPYKVQRDEAFPAVLGYLVGQLARERVAVVEGIEAALEEDDLKAFCAAVSSSGAVSLCHLVGTTPEAHSTSEALGGGVAAEVREVVMDDLRTARQQLTTAEGDELDMVVLGSPHFSVAEFRRLAKLLEGRQRDASVRFLVTTSRAMLELAREIGAIDALERFGGRTTVDTCILATPMLSPTVNTLMTNSAKYAYYTPGLLGVEVVFGSLEDCVRSAEQGRVVRDHAVWESA